VSILRRKNRWGLLTLLSSSLYAQDVKEPNVAGSFYPSDKKDLVRLIQSYLKDAEGTKVEGEPYCLISPHAGYVYSGPVAAYGFAALKGRQFDTVIILSATHFFQFKGVSVYKAGGFKTPLGTLDVDTALAKVLTAHNPDFLFFEPGVFEREHSIEVQLPFLQETLAPGFKILPLLMGGMGYEDCQALAGYLSGAVKGRSVLVIASTDLSHYQGYSEAVELDRRSINYIKALDAQGLWRACAGTGWNVCGVKAVVTALLYAKLKDAQTVDVLKYANSGDTAGDKNRVVGYTSVMISKTSGQKTSKNREAEMLTKDDKKKLLEIARNTITAYVKTRHRKIPAVEVKSEGLNLKRGAFVTLHKDGQLRGCIGLFTSQSPLYQTIAEMAIQSCSKDYRFPAVSKEELGSLEIEISVLSEPELIEDWRGIRLGIDGVIIKQGFSSGVFLPQVATETGWDLETFLGQLCSQKAGLAQDAFKDPGTKIYTFQADVFSEKDVK
jgi:AmmeMemoRadiSam system protein B/AmmeMemoRadiSam system protein A